MSEKHAKKRKPVINIAKVILTAEQIAAAKVIADAKALEAKTKFEALQAYAKALPKMSHRQLRGELRRTIYREHLGKPPAPVAGLTIAYATVLLAVLNNTQTKENPFAKLHSYPR